MRLTSKQVMEKERAQKDNEGNWATIARAFFPPSLSPK